MIEFPFEKVRLKNLGLIMKPFIPVKIIGPGRSVNLRMLLDSGADISLIPYSVGEVIGLEPDLANRNELYGVGEGSVSYLLTHVKIKIKDLESSIRIGWALIEEVPFILGRLDVFQKFAIEFREFENRILLKQHDE
jgi:hypothetical protein